MRVLIFSCALLMACSNNDDAPHDTPADTGSVVVDTGTLVDSTAPADAGDSATDATAETVPECYTNPKTHYEIINACTDAARVDKKPTGLPFLADGGLPSP